VEGNVRATTVERTEGANTMRRLLGLALLVLALFAAGCGGDDDDDDEGATPPPPPAATGNGEATTLENPADAGGALAFEKDELTAPAGEITLVMENPASLEHNIAIEGEGEGEVVGEGGTSRVTATLEPGEYTFYCSVPGHQAGGMEGTLTVTE
jgi:plastocyanin